jgi:hypothetical protein
MSLSLRCMTTSTCWPRIGPATYRATTQEDRVRREANPQVDDHLMSSPQVVESAPRTLSRWRHGFEPRWDYAGQRPYPGFHISEWPRIGPAAYTNRDAGDAVPSIAASPLRGRERFPSHGSVCQRTAHRECMPERPLSSTSVGSVNVNRAERSVSSRTNRETRISPHRASAAIRAARITDFP